MPRPNVLHEATARSIQSWTISASIHGLVFGAAFLLLSDLPRPAQREPFVWKAFLVEPVSASTQFAMIHPPSPRSQTSSAQPTPVQARPTEARRVIRTIHAVHRVRQAVRQKAIEHRPVIPEISSHVQTSFRQVRETLPVQRTHALVQQELSEAKPIVQEAGRIRQQFDQIVSRTASPLSTDRQVVTVEKQLTPVPQSVGAVQSIAATQRIEKDALQTVTTAEAKPITSAATEAAAIPSTAAPVQEHVAEAAGLTGAVIEKLVPTGGAASAADGEQIRSEADQLESASPASTSVPPPSDRGVSRSPREAKPDAEALEERTVIAAAPVAHVPMTGLPPRVMPPTQADFGWLADELRQQMERKKRYPRIARMHGWEGRIVLRAVIKADGSLAHEAIEESSGYEALDQDALDLMKQVCPLELKYPLGQPQVVVHVPIHYRIEQ